MSFNLIQLESWSAVHSKWLCESCRTVHQIVDTKVALSCVSAANKPCCNVSKLTHSCCRHDRKLKFKGKKAQKKGQKPRNPLNITFTKSNTKLSKAKSFKKKNKRKH